MKVCVVGNEARAMRMWWAPLLAVMRKAGHKVLCCVPHADATLDGSEQEHAQLEALCDGVRVYPLERRGLHPRREWASLRALWRILREEQPDVIFAYTVKPVVYCGLVRRLFLPQPRFYACIMGLGACFERAGVLQWTVSRLYRHALKGASTVFFQNTDDRNFFAHRRIFTGDAVLCRGTGVDTAHFACTPYESWMSTRPTFLLVGRLLASKGIVEFVEAARLLRQKHPHARFQLLGAPECGGIDMATVKAWHTEGHVEYLGYVADVRPFLRAASVLVLPSWREGAPCAILEGMSVGRAALVTDVPGCRDVVRHGVNGFIIPFERQMPARTASLADAMERFILDESLAPRMGAEGRRMAENLFDAHRVAQRLVGHMELL